MTQEVQAYRTLVEADTAAQRTQQAAIGRVLDPDRLRSPQDVEAARGRLAQLRQLERDSYNLMLQRQTQERVRIEARWPGSVAEFDEGVRNARARLDRQLAAEMAFYDAVGAVLDVLQNASGGWHVENRSYVFDQQHDGDAFDAANRGLQAASAAADALEH